MAKFFGSLVILLVIGGLGSLACVYATGLVTVGAANYERARSDGQARTLQVQADAYDQRARTQRIEREFEALLVRKQQEVDASATATILKAEAEAEAKIIEAKAEGRKETANLLMPFGILGSVLLIILATLLLNKRQQQPVQIVERIYIPIPQRRSEYWELLAEVHRQKGVEIIARRD